MKKFLPLIIFAILCIIPLIGLSSYLMHILILVLMWSVIGMAWNILGGYTGQVSFGHAAFFGFGAYTAGLLYQHLGISAWWGLPISIVILTALSLVIGYICLRLRGAYFALATLALGEVCRVAAENLVNFTQGNMGIMLRERTWVDKTWYFYVILLIAAATYLLIKIIMESKLGYYFVAIREDQDAAESLGIDTTFYKTISLCLSGVSTGIAGAFYMNYMGYIDPATVFPLSEVSIATVMVVMVGGAATYWGPVIGALIMVFLAEVIRSLPHIGAAHQTIFGVILILIIMFLPNGIVGDFNKLSKIFQGKKRKS
ncbi:MAG: branched-chain amino acid ABC transporter permease [Syntrophorhabdaceae bacterium]|nr:branched-chain amino acid ABC transporter permease [Syntrophorhabdales bacterium]MBP9560290.1 branched-chain amino acid ABC transporter permease [Syntrophorhabdaceae bacterium]